MIMHVYGKNLADGITSNVEARNFEQKPAKKFVRSNGFSMKRAQPLL
jgi:hypothetical protein